MFILGYHLTSRSLSSNTYCTTDGIRLPINSFLTVNLQYLSSTCPPVNITPVKFTCDLTKFYVTYLLMYYGLYLLIMIMQLTATNNNFVYKCTKVFFFFFKQTLNIWFYSLCCITWLFLFSFSFGVFFFSNHVSNIYFLHIIACFMWRCQEIFCLHCVDPTLSIL